MAIRTDRPAEQIVQLSSQCIKQRKQPSLKYQQQTDYEDNKQPAPHSHVPSYGSKVSQASIQQRYSSISFQIKCSCLCAANCTTLTLYAQRGFVEYQPLMQKTVD